MITKTGRTSLGAGGFVSPVREDRLPLLLRETAAGDGARVLHQTVRIDRPRPYTAGFLQRPEGVEIRCPHLDGGVRALRSRREADEPALLLRHAPDGRGAAHRRRVRRRAWVGDLVDSYREPGTSVAWAPRMTPMV
jgi:hypothetical protein